MQICEKQFIKKQMYHKALLQTQPPLVTVATG